MRWDLPAAELENRIAEVKQRMLAAGAHHVLDNITELPLYIATLNKSLNQ